MTRFALALVLAVVALVPGAPAASRAVPAPLVADPAYYRPVVVDGKTFPVARSNFFSFLEFDNGWHDPRFRLIGGKWRLVGVHEGIDIAAEEGTPIVSMTSGTVENVGWTFYSGTRVGVRGPDGLYYFYAHLSEVAPGIVSGAHVEPGDLLGRVGNTGYGPDGTEDEFPPHLHFGIDGPDGWVNPYPGLVRLYEAGVAASRVGEARLARLARDSAVEEWRAEADRLYTTFGIQVAPLGL